MFSSQESGTRWAPCLLNHEFLFKHVSVRPVKMIVQWSFHLRAGHYLGLPLYLLSPEEAVWRYKHRITHKSHTFYITFLNFLFLQLAWRSPVQFSHAVHFSPPPHAIVFELLTWWMMRWLQQPSCYASLTSSSYFRSPLVSHAGGARAQGCGSLPLQELHSPEPSSGRDACLSLWMVVKCGGSHGEASPAWYICAEGRLEGKQEFSLSGCLQRVCVYYPERSSALSVPAEVLNELGFVSSLHFVVYIIHIL